MQYSLTVQVVASPLALRLEHVCLGPSNGVGHHLAAGAGAQLGGLAGAMCLSTIAKFRSRRNGIRHHLGATGLPGTHGKQAACMHAIKMQLKRPSTTSRSVVCSRDLARKPTCYRYCRHTCLPTPRPIHSHPPQLP